LAFFEIPLEKYAASGDLSNYSSEEMLIKRTLPNLLSFQKRLFHLLQIILQPGNSLASILIQGKVLAEQDRIQSRFYLYIIS
jgi:hypothetical protein